MVLPGMGIDPQKMAQMQEVSRNISSVIRIDHAANTITVKMSSNEPQAIALIPSLIEQFARALAQQLSAFFAITGEIIDVNKPDEAP